MKGVQDLLLTISDTLAYLSKQFNSYAKQVDKAQGSKRTVKNKKSAPKKVKKTRVNKKAVNTPQAPVLDIVFDVIKASKKGITTPKIKEKTGLQSRQVSNAIYKLTKREKIEAVKRGVYVKKKKK